MNDNSIELKIDETKIEKSLIEFIQNQVRNKFRKKGIIIGISGGVDSAISANLAVKALGKENVFALLLPEEESDSRTTEFGKKICKLLDIKYEIISLTKIFNVMGIYVEKNNLLKEVFNQYNEKKHNTSLVFPHDLLEEQKLTIPIIKFYENNKEIYSKRLTAKQYMKIISIQNVKQRLRMIYLYKAAEERNFLVSGTTNKTESVLGQFVKYGDGGVDIEPLADLYKTQIYQLCEYYNIPKEIIERPPSPDTWSQYTSDEDFYWRMPLDYLDKILLCIEKKMKISEIALTLKIDKNKVKNIINNIQNIQKSTFHFFESPPICELK